MAQDHFSPADVFARFGVSVFCANLNWKQKPIALLGSKLVAYPRCTEYPTVKRGAIPYELAGFITHLGQYWMLASGRKDFSPISQLAHMVGGLAVFVNYEPTLPVNSHAEDGIAKMLRSHYTLTLGEHQTVGMVRQDFTDLARALEHEYWGRLAKFEVGQPETATTFSLADRNWRQYPKAYVGARVIDFIIRQGWDLQAQHDQLPTQLSSAVRGMATWWTRDADEAPQPAAEQLRGMVEDLTRTFGYSPKLLVVDSVVHNAACPSLAMAGAQLSIAQQRATDGVLRHFYGLGTALEVEWQRQEDANSQVTARQMKSTSLNTVGPC